MEGLYLEVMPSGSKLWRLKFRIHRVERRLSLGKYPNVSLAAARERKFELRKLIKDGRDPHIVQLENRQSAAIKAAVVFEQIALEWHSKQIGIWKQSHADRIKHRFKKYIFPFIGKYPLSEITPVIVLNCLQKAERTAPDLARRLKGMISYVFKYAIATDRATNDPTYGLEAALKKFKQGHYPSISVDEFPDFLLAIDQKQDRYCRQTYLGLKLMLLTFVRTKELVQAQWHEIDFEKKMWSIPAERMKRAIPHLVPLSNQAIGILSELFQMNGKRDFVFPGSSNPKRPMSDGTLLAAIKRMGYDGKMTGHGFRALAMGLLKEKLGYTHEIVDRQLAHVRKSNVDRAYDRAQFLLQRIEMMQSYSNYIDSILSSDY